ncbi:hypothetical protein RJV04_000743 [Salmonella enterica]|nr:hypothetical protein [Salmonella enterica]
METTEKTADRNWMMVSDGTKTVFLQVFGTFDICASQNAPGDEHAAHRFTNRELTVNPPDKMWIRAAGNDAKVRIVMT